MNELQEIPKRDILKYIKAYAHKFNGCLTGEVFRDAIREIERLRASNERLDNLVRELALLGRKATEELERHKQGWISVEERLPDKPGHYISYSQTGISLTWFNGDQVKDSFDELGFYLYPGITHWQPLPEPPKEVERG